MEKVLICMLYYWTDSSTEDVFLRMPINEQNPVEEVEQYFINFAEYFKSQIYEKIRKRGYINEENNLSYNISYVINFICISIYYFR